MFEEHEYEPEPDPCTPYDPNDFDERQNFPDPEDWMFPEGEEIGEEIELRAVA